MKKIIGLVVVLAVLVFGGYYGTGLVTETTIEKNIENINQSNGLLVELTQYHRGWYTSTAVLNFRIHIPERLSKNQNGPSTMVPAQDHAFQMPLTIYHGPIIFSDSGIKFGLGYARSDIEIPEMYTQKFDALFTSESTKPKLRLSFFVNYLNNSQINLVSPSFKLILKQGGEQFEWVGMNSHVNVSSNLRHIDGNVVVDGARFIKDKADATLGKVQTHYDLHQTPEGLYLGEATLSVPSFVIAENKKKILDLVQFDIRSSSDIDAGLFSTDFKTSLSHLTVHDRVYGPAVLKMSLKNLDAQVLAELNERINKMQQGTDIERQQAMLSLIPVLPKLFGQGVRFEISEFSFAVPEGGISGDLTIALPKGETGNPFQLIQKIQGHGRFKVPAAILKEIMTVSLQQKLLSQSLLQQEIAAQTKQNDPAQADLQAQVDQAKAEAPASVHADGTNNNLSLNQEKNPPMTAADISQKARLQADQKLSEMVQNGLLSLQGSEYVMEASLQQGQLTINDRPFKAAMLPF